MERPAVFRVENIDWNMEADGTPDEQYPNVPKGNLPYTLRIEVSELGPCELWHDQVPDDFVDVILQKVSDQTGWLVNDCDIYLIDGGA